MINNHNNENNHGHGEGKPELTLMINGKDYHWPDQFITGIQIKELGKAPLDIPLFLIIEEPWENELIHDHASVDLARPGIEQFVSKHKHEGHLILTIETPDGNWDNASFSKHLTIQVLIDKVIKKFKFAPDGQYKIKLKDAANWFDPSLTLEQCHLKDHAILTFSDLGKGA